MKDEIRTAATVPAMPAAKKASVKPPPQEDALPSFPKREAVLVMPETKNGADQ